VFLTSLYALGLDYRYEPIRQTLLRHSVSNFMSQRILILPTQITAQMDTRSLLEKDWLIVEGSTPFLLSPADLINFMNNYTGDAPVELGNIPAHREDLCEIDISATLSDALDALNAANVNAARVTNRRGKLLGIISRTQIESCYQTTPH
jgi:predicted transcriptional regulator